MALKAEDNCIPDLKSLAFKSIKRAHEAFLSTFYDPLKYDEESLSLAKNIKAFSQFNQFITPQNSTEANTKPQALNNTLSSSKVLAIKSIGDQTKSEVPFSLTRENALVPNKVSQQAVNKVIERVMEISQTKHEQFDDSIRDVAERALLSVQTAKQETGESVIPFSHGLIPRKAMVMPKPEWHPPWKLMRVISGHTGWVRCFDVEPANKWFATGSADRMIKIWDLASGTLRLSLTGHISTVRGLVISARHPYLFSCGEDKIVKCWDLEQNKVVRHYHGHLSAVYCIAQHPTIDVLMTGSRDSTCRVWDIRTKACVFTLGGHTNTVATVCSQASNPQIVTGSHDCTVRYWDLVAGKSTTTLTNHKKSIRSTFIHPKLNCMASASPDNIKEWKFPDGTLIQTLKGHKAIINALTINEDNVMVSGGDNGSLHFWDWKTGYNFDTIQTIVQPGSLDSEAGIFALGFDRSGTRLFSCEADKSIKIYKENDEATEETHPVKYKPELVRTKRF